MASSGKSTIINKLLKDLPPLKIKVLEESKTHMPIHDKLDDLHIDFFKDLVAGALDDQNDALALDRLYLTQVFRAKADIKDYSEVEEMLMPYSPLTIFLKIDEDKIAGRIEKAIEHRDPSWGEYAKTKGKTITEIADYYIKQQRHQLKALKQSKIPYKIFNTTNHDYDAVVEQIKQVLRPKHFN